MNKNKFFVTTPIYYVTDKPHLGSLYSTLLADVACRWNRLLGKKTFFLTGTDEHGQKVAQAAERAGESPKKFVDHFVPRYKEAWDAYHIDYSYFIRTTDQEHTKAVQQWLEDLIEKGDIYKAKYEGWYCVPCETYLTDKEVADQNLSVNEKPVCISCARVTEFISEESYFFRLSAYQEKLLQFYDEHPEFIIPKERINEVKQFVKSGLRDLSISRTTVKWGIPFANDPEHVTYVWADALNNYITAIGYAQKNKEEDFQFWWPADLHVLGKDIVRFHAIYWPAFLMASNLPLPKRLLVHGWIKINEQKMSKSLGNVVDPMVLKDQYGADEVRYYLTRYMSITQDSSFSTQDLERSINSDLANDLGNLLNRVVTLAHKYSIEDVHPPQNWSEDSLDLRDLCWNLLDDYTEYMNDNMYHIAVNHVWKFINQTNAYFHAKEPWKLAKKNSKQFEEVISATCHSLFAIAGLLWPVMPKKSEEIFSSLGIEFSYENNFIEHLKTDNWNKKFMLKIIPPIFKKVDQKNEEQTEKPKETYISIDDVAKVELCVGTIKECEEVPKSEKLYKLQVDLGKKGIRQVLAGIRKHYTPEELIGKQAIFVANLKPRKMMGLESQGMMLLAQDDEGNLRLTTVEKSVPNGTRLR